MKKLLLVASLLLLAGCTTKREVIRTTEIKIIEVPVYYPFRFTQKTKLYYQLQKEFEDASVKADSMVTK
ncbi:hypothetical protein EZS27_001362 [termite gut metagenome]|uniref:Lipoprotein n=1 Tax=termite gut metagenome TaxID=433724 RepID=A0A5J4SY77_9ZZZZ